MKRLYFTFILFIGLCIGAYAQSMHVIIFANTIDENIGCIDDVRNLSNEMAIAADVAGLQYVPYIKIGEDCTKGNLVNIVNGLNSKDNDVILFYYSGHGAHSGQQMNEKFPQMCMKYSSIQDQREFMSVRATEELIDKKPARLRMLITDCCNSVFQSLMPRGFIETQKDATSESGIDEAALKNLFIKAKGKIIATSSKITQTSGGAKGYGGIYTNSFIDKLLGAEYKDVKADWYEIFNETKKDVLSKTANKQEPVFEVNVSYSGSTPSAGQAQTPAQQQTTTTPPPAPTQQQTPGTTISTLEQQLAYLVDRSVSESTRLSKISAVMSQCFTPDAMVQVIGRNLKTTVDVIEAEDYLRRIVQNDAIKKVNVISQAEGGARNKLIKVHEIRK